MTLIGILANRLTIPTGGETIPTPPPDPNTTVATWEFDGNGNVVGTGNVATLTDVETGVGSLVSGVAGTSIGLNGVTAKAMSAHHPAYQLAESTLVLYAQAARLPAVGINEVMVAVDDSVARPAGGCQINFRNDAGTGRINSFYRDVGTGNAVFIGTTTGDGVGTVPLNTGFLVALAMSSAGATLFLRVAGGAAQDLATSTLATPAMSELTVPISWGQRDNANWFQGVVDRTTLYNYRFTLADFAALPPPVTVTWSPAPPPTESDQANCFVESGANTVVVNTMAELETAVNAAPAGRQILIAAGTYTGGTLTFNRDGTEANPIVIRTQGAMGSVTINGAVWTVANTASWLAFEKLRFGGASQPFLLLGDHNRISRCFFTGGGTKIRMETTRDCRVDHCEFSGAIGNSIELRGALTYGDNTAARNLIDYCYFHGQAAGTEIQAIDSFGDTSIPRNGNDVARGRSVTVDHCLFDDLDNNGEFVCLKIGGMIWRYCTFTNLAGYFQSRAAHHCEIRSCWFENVDRIMMWGHDQLVIGNRFMGAIDCWAPCGNGTYAGHIDGSDPSNLYKPSTNSQFIGNRFGSGHLDVGRYHNTNVVPGLTPANNLLLAANTRDSGGNAHVFTNAPLNPGATNVTVNATTTAPFTAAVKLAPADVGLNAPDPLCP